jgi:transmembrane sensor
VIEREKIEEAAAHWVAREDRGFLAGEADHLQAWLAESDANRVAYLRLKTRWESDAPWSALRPALSAPARLFRLAAVAAMVLMLGVTFTLHVEQPVPGQANSVVYATGAKKRPVQLSDGTRIQLNAQTRVETRITAAARTVILDRGEAYFDVAHEQKRPFVVTVGDRRITDLGTKFSVRRDEDSIRVVVTEGRIKIATPTSGMAPVYAGSGDVVIAKADETLVTSRSDDVMQDALSWRSEMLTFNQMTLEDAAAQFNKYNRRHIVVRGNARTIRIGGSFRSDNIDAFAYLVQNALGLKVSRSREKITISN